MKTIYTFGERRARRNFTVADIRSCKGVSKLTQTNPATTEEAAAAAAAGVDLLICGQSQYEAVRAGAPEHFITAALMLTDFPTELETTRAAFRYMELGADAIYTPRRPEFVATLAAEGIPVMGHVGLVPRKSTWVGGLRCVGKTGREALALWDQFEALQQAGAFGVEVEVIPQEVLEAMSQRTSLITFSLGSGKGGDVIYMFASDILGDNQERPRHAKAYADLFGLRKQMQNTRIAAFAEFIAEARSGVYPGPAHTVSIAADELERFLYDMQRRRVPKQ